VVTSWAILRPRHPAGAMICRSIRGQVSHFTLHRLPRLSVTVMRRAQLQEIPAGETEALILSFHEQLLQRFLTDRELIPPGHLVEVGFEEPEERPLE
jgi:hypothetical protein